MVDALSQVHSGKDTQRVRDVSILISMPAGLVGMVTDTVEVTGLFGGNQEFIKVSCGACLGDHARGAHHELREMVGPHPECLSNPFVYHLLQVAAVIHPEYDEVIPLNASGDETFGHVV